AGEIVAGVAFGGTTSTSMALVAVGGKGLLPPLRYLWSDALADGAGGPAALAAWGPQRPVMTAGAANSAVVARPHVVVRAKHHRHRRHHVRRNAARGWGLSLV